jgi:hypothetical protein
VLPGNTEAGSPVDGAVVAVKVTVGCGAAGPLGTEGCDLIGAPLGGTVGDAEGLTVVALGSEIMHSEASKSVQFGVKLSKEEDVLKAAASGQRSPVELSP